MKISEMTNDQAADAMIRISGVATSICKDKDVQDLLVKLSESREENVITAIPKFLPQITALALKKHKNDLYEIISALNQISVDEVGKMSFGETVNTIKANFDTLKDFFT